MRIFYLANKIPANKSISYFLVFFSYSKSKRFYLFIKGANKYKMCELGVSMQQYEHKKSIQMSYNQ